MSTLSHEPAHPDPFELADDAAKELRRRLGVLRHDVAVVLGSGWGACADALGDGPEIALSELPGFPAMMATGHVNRVRSVVIGGQCVLVFLGRCHLYEGHSAATVVHGVRMAAAAGCETVVLTNASGCMEREWGIGVPVLITDHINTTGHSPLTGPLPPNGVRFIDMGDAYSPRLRALAKQIDPTLHEGRYLGTHGPQFETPAEIQMGVTLGCSLVGMSTVLETIAARHLGMEVLGIALSTNLAAGISEVPLTVDDVIEAAREAQPRMGALLHGVISAMG
jgi:purine-nucleoside phosphorylase